ncbi:hypothetical protein CK203_027849 [Vitis vinifera]|uniref:Uncharacterized protein n=2 Tax=Vitis vinifera TaxID=29760 RepID=A0A438J3R1_VITVI|nr:hypothetical protein CK203_027849 [Vitis vinifera]
MSADHLQFLKNKFILDLEDAEEEHTGENEIPLRSHFLQIRDVLKAKDITASTPIRLKNCLYNAISALEECVVLSEKREPRKKEGPMQGYTLAELWLICKTRCLLLQIKKKLTATAEMVASSSSSTSLTVISTPNPDEFHPVQFRNLYEQVSTILDRLVRKGKGLRKLESWGLGLGSSGGLWCRSRSRRAVGDSGESFEGKRYLMVLDGIWDINIHWYFKLKEKLKSLSGDGYGHVIITSRLPHKARMMVGPHKLYQMQPPSSMEQAWRFKYGSLLECLKEYRLQMKDEVLEHCDGLPLAMHTLAAAIHKQILGTE